MEQYGRTNTMEHEKQDENIKSSGETHSNV